jgi:hypothetical protein
LCGLKHDHLPATAALKEKPTEQNEVVIEARQSTDTVDSVDN